MRPWRGSRSATRIRREAPVSKMKNGDYRNPQPGHESSGSLLASARRHPRRLLGLLTLVAIGCGVVAGCDSERWPDAGTDPPLPPQAVPTTGLSCTEGDARECSATLAIHDGILSCYDGLQTCESGRWGNCMGTSIVERPEPELTQSDGTRLQATTTLPSATVADCTSNPCDPFCQGFSQQPTTPLVAGEGLSAGFSWDTGSPSNVNAELALGTNQPCTTGDDCQFNQRCTDVVTGSACSHAKCTTGSALIASCDDCVGLICKSNAACCQRGWNCAHDVCTVGTKLDLTCDDGNPGGSAASCVRKVNAKDPGCTSSSWTANCVAHAQKECGAACGSCGVDEVLINSRCYHKSSSLASWTAARTACQARGTGYDLATVDTSTENGIMTSQSLVTENTWIGYYKTSGSWKWTIGTPTYTRWGAGQPDASGSPCARMQTDGYWYDTTCTNTYKYVCEGPAPVAATTPSWTQTCVNAVATTCDATCSTATPAATTGKCIAWKPGETDAKCASKPDLALGVPCDDGVVPICNHGGAQAASGVTLAYYSAASGVYPSASPTATPKGTCPATQDPIPPGECVNVECPTTGTNPLVDGDRLVVNRAATTSECSALDNWSVYGTGVSCGAPTCQGTSTSSTFKPVRMFIMVDRSYSMVCHPPSYPSTCFGENGTTCKCSGGRWAGAQNSLKAFFQSASSAGVGVAMDFFPLAAGTGAGDGCAGSSATTSLLTDSVCSPTICENPLIPLGLLAATAAPTDNQEKLLVNAITSSPVNPPNFASASTPSYPALQGALNWAKKEQALKPNETFVVVFVTDGDPSTCLKSLDKTTTNNALADLAKAAYQTSGVRTYTIGMEGSNTVALDKIAASGGTVKSFVVGGSSATDITTPFIAALNSIATQSASCTLPYSASTEANPANAVLTYTLGTTTTTITKRTDSTGCGTTDGWYFDNNTTPTQAILCPVSCNKVKANTSASVKLDVPCAAELEPATYTQTYPTNCADNQYPLWQFLTYDTTNTQGGDVLFRVRTADTEAGLAGATWTTAKTATQAAPDCKPGIATCPVDMVALLGNGASKPFLQLEMTVTPTSLGKTPTLDSWQVTFTCPYNQ
jgi:hypothetical protein